MRSADIVKNCREVALRVEISGEWGELGDTLRLAATEIERLRRAVKSWERESQAHAAEVERLKKSEAVMLQELKIEGDQVSADHDQIKSLKAEVERLRLTGREVRAIRAALHTGVQDNDVVAIRSILKRHGGGE